MPALPTSHASKDPSGHWVAHAIRPVNMMLCKPSTCQQCAQPHAKSVLKHVREHNAAFGAQVRQDPRDGFYVEGLQRLPCASARSALAAMSSALAWRHTRAHRLNASSSRSHCLVTLTLHSLELPEAAGSCAGGGAVAGNVGAAEAAASGEGGGTLNGGTWAGRGGEDGAQVGGAGGVRRVGRLVLVDLAGSERLRQTGSSEREALRETGHINKSLFTLGQVCTPGVRCVRRGSGLYAGGQVCTPGVKDAGGSGWLWVLKLGQPSP